MGKRRELYIEMKKVLLIGGAGFIGHHLALALATFNYDVHIADSFEVNNLIAHMDNDMYFSFIVQRSKLIQKCAYIHIVDARDYHELSKLVRTVKPDIIVHLAAVAHANKSNRDPHCTFDHSLRTLENTLDASIRMGVEQFIYFSSSMVYGDFAHCFPSVGYSLEEMAVRIIRGVDENSPLSPKGIYGALKLSGEMIVKAYNEVFDIPYTIIRPSALYGERCVSRRVIQVFIENVMQGKNLIVAGDGEEKLDFTYIKDFVHGFMLMIHNEKAYNETFNLTYGESRSIKEVAELVIANNCLDGNIGYITEPKIIHKERDKLMPIRGTLSVYKAKTILGYVPSYPIEVGVKQYMEWYNDDNKR